MHLLQGIVTFGFNKTVVLGVGVKVLVVGTGDVASVRRHYSDRANFSQLQVGPTMG